MRLDLVAQHERLLVQHQRLRVQHLSLFVQCLRLLVQRLRLPVRFFLRHLPALVREHHPPGDDAAYQQQSGEGLDEAEPQRQCACGTAARLEQQRQLVGIEHGEQAAQQRHHHGHQQQVVAEAGLDVGPGAARQQPAHEAVPLHREPSVRLAQVFATRVERAAQRADGAAVGRAMGEVVALVVALADHAAREPSIGAALDATRSGRSQRRPGPWRLRASSKVCRRRRLGVSCQVVAALRPPRDERRDDQCRDECDQRRERLCQRPERAEVGGDREQRGHAHRAHAHRVDVVQMRTLELDAGRRPADPLVDHQVGHHGHHPADGDVRVEAEHLAERLEHVELHQHQRDQRVEHHPHHAARVAVREPGEEVRPGERAGVGVGDVDLELRHEHEEGRGRDGEAVLREHRVVGHEVHLRRVDRSVGRHRVADGEVGQQRAGQHLEHAGHHPAGPADDHAGPPLEVGARAAVRLRSARFRHETKIVGLLAHLRDERDADGHGGAELHQVEAGRACAAVAAQATVLPQLAEHARMLVQHVGQRHDQHREPERLRPHLQPADGGDAMGHQRNHHQRAEQVAPGRRNVECEFDGVGHDGRLEREEDESEARVDERGDGRADVAEAGATREQVHVDAMSRRIHADRPAGEEDDQPGGEDGPERVDEAVVDQQRAAHRLEHQKRGRTERRVCHAQGRPLSERAWREAQRVVFHGLARDPAVVVAANLDDLLHWRGAHGCGWLQGLCHGAIPRTGVTGARAIP